MGYIVKIQLISLSNSIILFCCSLPCIFIRLQLYLVERFYYRLNNEISITQILDRYITS